MSRSPASDPTLFTSATPHASSKQSATHISLNSKAPPNETPREKVARLREASRRAKLAQQSPWERVVASGRVWADRLHRTTTLSLIGFTAVAAGITMFALGDMMLYNRRRRNEFNRLRKEQKEHALALATEAEMEGRATAEQVTLLQEERERVDEVQRRKEQGIFKRIKDGLVGGLQKEDVKGGTMGIGVKSVGEQRGARGELGIVQAVEDMVSEAKDAGKKDGSAMPVVGGPLDQHAAKAAKDVEKASRSWWDWVTRR